MKVERDDRELLFSGGVYPLVVERGELDPYRSGWCGIVYHREDADLIAHRFNTFPDLLAALKALLAAHATNNPFVIMHANAEANAVVARAEKRS